MSCSYGGFKGKLLLGCSGWYYKDWVGPFYREETESKLAAYSKVFKTAEINSTFYAYPSKGTVMGWLKYTQSDFIYSAKLPRLITHKKKLDLNQGVEKLLIHRLKIPRHKCYGHVKERMDTQIRLI